jgi:hypothetical protein
MILSCTVLSKPQRYQEKIADKEYFLYIFFAADLLRKLDMRPNPVLPGKDLCFARAYELLTCPTVCYSRIFICLIVLLITHLYHYMYPFDSAYLPISQFHLLYPFSSAAICTPSCPYLCFLRLVRCPQIKHLAMEN